ncbi:hypothetical protein AAHE18_07G034700 [Arachis hypogaea]
MSFFTQKERSKKGENTTKYCSYYINEKPFSFLYTQSHNIHNTNLSFRTSLSCHTEQVQPFYEQWHRPQHQCRHIDELLIEASSCQWLFYGYYYYHLVLSCSLLLPLS